MECDVPAGAAEDAPKHSSSSSPSRRGASSPPAAPVYHPASSGEPSIARLDSASNSNSSASVAGPAATAEQAGGLLDRGLERLKSRSRSVSVEPSPRRASQDSPTGARRLSKLVPVVSMRRRSKNPKGIAPGSHAPDSPANASAITSTSTSTTTTTTNAALARTQNHSSSNNSSDSLGGRHANSVASSILTEDSDPGPALPRPSLASHPSHIGYLTLTSPLVTSAAVQPAQPPSGHTEQHFEPFARAASNASPTLLLDTPQPAPSDPVPSDPPKPQPRPITLNTHNFVRKINVASPARSDSITTVETPSTLVTPPTPDQPQHHLASTLGLPIAKAESPPAALHSFNHRRAKSASAAHSKFSLASPLPPAPEEVKTPGGSLTQPTSLAQPSSQTSSTGFFSSVFSATQSAVSSLSNTFSSSSGSSLKVRGQDPDKPFPPGEEDAIWTSSHPPKPTLPDAPPPPEPAVATLGSGSLSLSHLGISDPSSDGNMSSNDEARDDLAQAAAFTRDNSTSASKRDEWTATSDRVATPPHADKHVAEKAASISADQGSVILRPKSAGSAVGSLAGDITPPRSLKSGTDPTLTHRSGSVRSRVSDRRKRHRKNSSYSNSGPSTIGSALVATHSALVNPSLTTSQRPSGYTAANPKRNKDFHQLFRSVPEDDFLIEDYSAALQREILLHGRLYISEQHICFSSNIMGWITNLVVGFDEVVALEKKNTAMIFPNAIVIQTLHAKNVFASLINRENTYELLLNIWRSKHPNLKATENGHVLDNSVPEIRPAGDNDGTDEESDDEDDFDDDEDETEIRPGGFIEGSTNLNGGDVADHNKTSTQRVASGGPGPILTSNGAAKTPFPSEQHTVQETVPGPLSHPPTECSDQDTHYDKQCLDETLPAPLGKVYSMLFGPLSGSFMPKFLEEEESSEIHYEDDKKGMGEGSKSFSYSFIKKLSGGLGPKQTKCLVSQTLDAFDLEKAVSVTCSTLTPDVPSGNAFVTKTRYCLMWGPNNSTRLLMNSTTEWSGKSFLRGAIDKGAESGQQAWGKELAAFLRAQLVSQSTTKGGRVKTKGRRKKIAGSSEAPTPSNRPLNPSASKSHGGLQALLEPLYSVFETLSNILRPITPVSAVFGLSLLLVACLWLQRSRSAAHQSLVDRYGLMTPHRLAAYEEVWRREEGELWSWLEDRISLDNMSPNIKHHVSSMRQSMLERDAGSRLGNSQMSDRQIEDAIRVTEERLEALKVAIARKRSTASETATC